MKTIAIIQARMGSTRLPGKVLRYILDKPMLWHIVQRLGSILEIAKVIVATSDQKSDDRIAHFCRKEGIPCFRGSETDVLDRFYRAAKNESFMSQGDTKKHENGDTNKHENPEAVIRITGDCPLIDPHLVRRLLLRFIESAAENPENSAGCIVEAASCRLFSVQEVRGAKQNALSTMHEAQSGPRSWEGFDHLGLATGAGVADPEFRQSRFPDGLDAEVIRFEALERAWLEAKDPLEREHVTPFIWKHPERFRVGCLASDEDYSSMRWTVDNPEDLELVRDIYRALYEKNPCFGMEDVLAYLKDTPGLMEKNARFIGREGYEVFWARGE